MVPTTNTCPTAELIVVFVVVGRSQTTLTNFWLFFDHLPPSVDIFYLINVDKKSTFLDYLTPSSCQRSLWTPPSVTVVVAKCRNCIMVLEISSLLCLFNGLFKRSLFKFQPFVSFQWHV